MSERTGDVVLSVKDLHVSFYTNRRCNRVLRGVSFDIRRGRTLCIVGESGCGKSVTANAILRLLPELSRIEQGSVTYWREGEKGIRLDQLKKNGREMRALRGKDIAIIFQDPMTALNPVMTVGEQLMEVVRTHEKLSKAQAKEKVIRALEIVGVKSDRFNDYPHQFSGGMKQRVVITMALLCNPVLLIADEPTTALDVTIQAQVLELIKNLQEKTNTAMLLVTHDLGVVAETCDNVAIMYAGEIVEYGTVEEVFRNALHPYTKGLFESIPKMTGDSKKLIPIEGMPPNPADLPRGCCFHPRCRYCTDKCKIEKPVLRGEGHLHRCHNV